MQRKKVKKLKKKYKILLVLFVMIGIYPFACKVFGVNKNEINVKEFLNQNTKVSYTEESVFPNEVYGVPVHTEIIEASIARPTTKRLIQYIVIHETDNVELGAGAHNHSDYLKENNETPTSWHYTVDDHEIYHHIPDNEIAHHAGDDEGNQYGIGIELCVNKDGNFNKTFDNASKLVAYLLKAYDLDISAIKTHHDFSGKDCPNGILKNNRMEEFKKRVELYLEQT